MHAKPWHCPPALQALSFSEFIRAQWATVADRPRYFPQVAELGGVGQPLQHDRHPLTGLPFENLYALRRAKLAALLGFFNRGCTLVFCRMEEVIARPQAFLNDLHTELQVPGLAAEFRPVHKRLGSRFAPAVEPRPATPKVMPPDDLAFLRAQVDCDQERLLGYDYT